MKRPYRAMIQAALIFSLPFVLLTLDNTRSLAQQTQNPAAAQAPSTRPDANLFPLTVTVTDRKRNYVRGLLQNNFAIYDGKEAQQIAAFSTNDVPLSVGILFDASMSVRGDMLKQARNALRQFFQLSHKSNEYFLIGFNMHPQVLQDWTMDTESLAKQLDLLQPAGNTALYDACYLGVAKVLTGRYRKRVVILVSDGQDNNSHYTYAQLRRLLEESNVLLYSVGIISSGPGSSLGLEGQTILDEFSSMTGGAASFPETATQVQASFDALAVELRNQYLIEFTPTANDKKRHKLKLKVTAPADAPLEMQRLTVRSREKFYAQTPPR